MLKQLRLKLTLLCTCITCIILAVVTAGAYYIARQQRIENSETSFRSDYNSIIYHISTQTILDQSWLAQTENGNRLLVHIEDNGVPLLFNGAWTTATPRSDLIRMARERASALGFDIAVPPLSSLSPDCLFFELYGSSGERYRAAAASVPTPLGWVGMLLLKDMELEDAAASRQVYAFTALALLGTLLLLCFSWWFTGWAIRPVEKSQQQQRQFVADASHELRTPLAVIQASSSAIQQATPEQAVHFSQTISRECKRMARFVNDLLLLARADAHNWSIHPQPVDLDTLLLNQWEQFEEVAAKKRIAISLSLDEDAPLPKVLGDEQRLTQVLSVLLDNAVSYTPEGGKIHISAAQAGNVVRVTVSDTGPGIPEGAQARIFERFYRADQARADKDHYGLGLSIAREIVTLHKGKIAAKNNAEGCGSTFIVELPVEGHKTKRPCG